MFRKLHKPSLKLAALYLVIIMAISFAFSMSVYQLSVQELDRGLRRPGRDSILLRNSGLLPNSFIEQVLEEQERLYNEARDRVVERLVLANLLILLLGGAVSYFLAKRTLQPIEAARDSQRRFTADASHELRTPIAAMQTETEVALLNPKLTLVDAKAQLQSNLEELAKLTALTEGLLQLARGEDSALAKEQVLITEVVNAAITDVLPLADKKQIGIALSELPSVSITANKSSMQEALVIVLENAVKYSPEHTQITVNVTADDQRVTIVVKDQGRGIAPAELPYIFERFYRADTSRNKERTEGYGLGLAIAKNIINLHDGTISVTSQLGKGSEFTFVLPARKA